MGKLFFDATTDVGGTTSSRRLTATDLGGDQGLIAVGQGVTEFATQRLKTKEQEELTRLDNLQSSAMMAITKSAIDLETQAPLGADGHTDNVADAVKQFYDDPNNQATASFPAGKRKLAAQKAALGAHFAVRGINFEAKQQGLKASTELVNSVNADILTLRQTPDQATFVLLLETQMTKLDDTNGLYAKRLGAAKLAELKLQVAQDLTAGRVQGIIADDPTHALELLKAGAFNDTIDPNDVKTLQGEATTAINGIKAAAKADRAEQVRLEKEARIAAGNEIFDMMVTGKDRNGNPVSFDQIKDYTMRHPALKGFGGKDSKDSIINSIDLRATGITTEQQDQSRAAVQHDFHTIWTTGKSVTGKPVSDEDLVQMIVDDPHLEEFGSGSKSTMLKMLEDRKAGVTTPEYKEQQRIFDMVLTRKNAAGNDMTDTQMKSVIRSSILDATGTGSKKDFIGMVDDAAKLRKDEAASLHEQNLLERIYLPESDPRHISVEDLNKPENIAKVGFDRIRALRKDAEGLLDAEMKPVIDAQKAVFDRFKASITSATLTKPDKTGDDLYGAFMQEVRRRVKKKIDNDEDPMVLFDDRRGNSEYVGHIVGNYIRTRVGQSAGARARFDPFTPVLSGGQGTGNAAPQALPDETPAEYLLRIRGQ